MRNISSLLYAPSAITLGSSVRVTSEVVGSELENRGKKPFWYVVLNRSPMRIVSALGSPLVVRFWVLLVSIDARPNDRMATGRDEVLTGFTYLKGNVAPRTEPGVGVIKVGSVGSATGEAIESVELE